MGKAKKSRTGNMNYHHLLYQCKHWSQGYARMLRMHPYLGKVVPKYSLHSLIHSKIHDVPTPNKAECKRAYKELEYRIKTGQVNVRHDTLEQRLDFLIEMWSEKCPATVAILQWQKEIISKFYAGRGDKAKPELRQ